MKEIKLYSWSHCPYCRAAKKLLDDRGLKYTEIDIYNDAQTRRQLQNQTGHYTVPFVFIGETFVGGFSELKEIEFNGKLDDLI
ncbi:glutaredoxin domain-containing protein [Acetobacterium sp.]|uniref:glutaredoxin domain-containing protein n=1 Tax=Acetobacterium sp. TaxID=1872094 RepID=UPI0035930420